MVIGSQLSDEIYVVNREGKVLERFNLLRLANETDETNRAEPSVPLLKWSFDGTRIMAVLGTWRIIVGDNGHERILVMTDKGWVVWNQMINATIVDATFSADGNNVAATTTCDSAPQYPARKYLGTCGLTIFNLAKPEQDWQFQIDAPGGYLQARYRYLPAALSPNEQIAVTATSKDILVFNDTGNIMLRFPVSNASFLDVKYNLILVGGPRFMALYSTIWTTALTLSAPSDITVVPGQETKISLQINTSGWTRNRVIQIHLNSTSNVNIQCPDAYGQGLVDCAVQVGKSTLPGTYRIMVNVTSPGFPIVEPRSVSLELSVKSQENLGANNQEAPNALLGVQTILLYVAIAIGVAGFIYVLKKKRSVFRLSIEK